MLTNKDIKKLKEILPTKKEVATKKDLQELRKGTRADSQELRKEFQAGDAKLLKEIFTTQKDLDDFREEMRESFSSLQTSVDNYAKKADTYFQEMVMLSHKVDRMEKWIHQIAKKVGLELKA